MVEWSIQQLEERLHREFPSKPWSPQDINGSPSNDPRLLEEDVYCSLFERGNSDHSLYAGQPAHVGQQAEALWPFSRAFLFSFKERMTRGHAIHLAAVSNTGAAVVDCLLEMRADPNDDWASPLHDRQRCFSLAGGEAPRKKSLRPIHFAAGTGSPETIRLLVLFKADINGRTMLGGLLDYTALHEAAYHGRVDCVDELLALGAEVDSLNRKKETPLHVTAHSAHENNFRVARRLTQARADVSLQSAASPPWTPLMLACHSSFPSDKLYLLMQRCIDDVLLVATVDPSATLDMLANEHRMSFRTHAAHHSNEKWRKALTHPKKKSHTPTYEHLVNLIRISPQVAAEVVDLLSVCPEVRQAASYYHPIPRHSRRDLWAMRRCQYVEDTEWRKVRVNGSDNYPSWHDQLAPRTGTELLENFVSSSMTGLMTRSDLHTRVEVKMLKIPNVVNLSVIFALSETDNLSIFRKAATQAILDCAWGELVRPWYNAHFFIRCVELLTLLFICVLPTQTEVAHRISWSILCVTSCREITMEITQAARYKTRLRNFMAYITNPFNWLDIASMLMFAVLVWSSTNSSPGFRGDARRRRLLAMVCFQRWIQIVHMLCAYSALDLGYSLIPLMSSICKVGGMTVISAVFLCAFVHSFFALDENHPCSADLECTGAAVTDWVAHTILLSFRLLVMGDGDGINWLLDLDSEDGARQWPGDKVAHGWLYFSVIIFCVFILNLYIAVHGQAYEESSSIVIESFYAKRASVVLGPMLQPCLLPRAVDMIGWRWWKQTFLRRVLDHQVQTYIVWMVASATVCFALVHAGVRLLPSVFMFCMVRVGDSILLRRPLREHACGMPLPFVDKREAKLDRQRGDGHESAIIDPRQKDIIKNMRELSGSKGIGSQQSSVYLGSVRTTSHPLTEQAMIYDAAEELYLWWCAWDVYSEPYTDHLEILDRLDGMENTVSSLAHSVSQLEKMQQIQIRNSSDKVNCSVDGSQGLVSASSTLAGGPHRWRRPQFFRGSAGSTLSDWPSRGDSGHMGPEMSGMFPPTPSVSATSDSLASPHKVTERGQTLHGLCGVREDTNEHSNVTSVALDSALSDVVEGLPLNLKLSSLPPPKGQGAQPSSSAGIRAKQMADL